MRELLHFKYINEFFLSIKKNIINMTVWFESHKLQTGLKSTAKFSTHI